MDIDSDVDYLYLFDFASHSQWRIQEFPGGGCQAQRERLLIIWHHFSFAIYISPVGRFPFLIETEVKKL